MKVLGYRISVELKYNVSLYDSYTVQVTHFVMLLLSVLRSAVLPVSV
jgi:hypothetical protein